MKAKIEEVEPEFAQKLDPAFKKILQELSFAVPQNYRLRLSLLDSSGRKKRSNAAADKWSPQSDRIEIWFEKIDASQEAGKLSTALNDLETTMVESLSRSKIAETPEVVLVRALHRAESTPGWNFVSLKKFRDEVLPSEPFPPGALQPTDVHWQNLLSSAIDQRLIIVGKAPNPKSPQFPVTTIRLNRLMPQVHAILGETQSADLDFQPVEIRGEPLSATILRERR